MSDPIATIDWYADGFEVRLEGGAVLGNIPEFIGLFGVACMIGSVCSSTTALGADLLLPAIGSGVGLVMLVTAGVLGAVSRERRPVRVLAVDGHRLLVRRGTGEVELDVLLEEVTGVDLDRGTLEIGYPGGVCSVDATSQIHGSLGAVLVAVRAAVSVRRRPETPADRRAREEALAALERLRQPT